MPGYLETVLVQLSVWALPVIIAITFHEAAHAIVASALGDPTARLMGRVTLNPIPHIDPFGTIILPGLLLLLPGSMIFGYAKPVPVNIARLGHPRRDMMLVAAAGPISNILLAVLCALLLHVGADSASWFSEWWVQTLNNAILLNLVLAVFNMIPVPPFDGGRIVTGLLPEELAARFARLERVGLVAVLLFLFVVPYLLAQSGIRFEPARYVIWYPVQTLMEILARATGHI